MTDWIKRCSEKRSLHRSGASCVPHESEDWGTVLLREGLPTQCGYMDCFKRVPSTARFNLRPPHHTIWCGRTLYGSWKYPATRYDESGGRQENSRHRGILFLIKKISRTTFREILDFKYLLTTHCPGALQGLKLRTQSTTAIT